MGFWQWKGLIQPRLPEAAIPVATPAAGPAATPPHSPTPEDLEEQRERIRNLIADTALKVETIKLGRLQLRVAAFAVIVSVTSALIGLVTIYETHRSNTLPHNAYIFLTPDSQIML
jgi:hypothetical protein